MSKYHRWTKAEDRRLAALAPLGMKELCRSFDYLNRHQIRGRAYRLGLRLPRFPVVVRHRPIPIPSRAHPLVKALIAEANRQMCPLRVICERAGISKSALSQWRYVRNPSLVMLIAAFNVLGKDIGVIQLRDGSDAVETVDNRQGTYHEHGAALQ